jgi:hypothetical protein
MEQDQDQKYKVVFHGDTRTFNNKTPVMAILQKNHAVICDYTELGLYIMHKHLSFYKDNPKPKVRPIYQPLLMVLQLINMFTDIRKVEIVSDNQQFKEFMENLKKQIT